jgi:hypothetical protein
MTSPQQKSGNKINFYRGNKMQKQRLNKEQKAAVNRYENCLREEDRYLGSVFANHIGQKQVEEKTKAAFSAAKRLGVDHLC